MKAKIGGVLFGLLFALGFGAGGYFGISQFAHQLGSWWDARSWQPVEATVLQTQLERVSGDSTTYRATARYRYSFNGRQYEGDRVGISNGSDNVGNWQQEHYQQLISAQRENRSITVWVDQAHPERSVLDRDPRWTMIALTIPFATLFPLVSIGALWMTVRILLTPSGAPQAKPDPNAAIIKSSARGEALAIWMFAVCWNLIAFPIAIAVIPGMIGRSWLWLFVLLFPLVGTAMLWIAISKTVRLLRYGRVELTLSPQQPRVGESFNASVAFARPPPAGAYAMSLRCERVDSRGESDSSTTLWQQERTAPVYGERLAVSFDPPVHLKASEPKTGIYHCWQIKLTFPDSKDERSFEIALQPAREGLVRAADRNDLHVEAFGAEPSVTRWAYEQRRGEAANPEVAARQRLWLKRGLELIVAAFVLTVLWQILGGMWSGSKSTDDIAVERSRMQTSLSNVDRSLIDAVVANDAQGVEAALSAGANVNAVNDWGGTPLLVAARTADAKLLKRLIDAGANVDFAVTMDNEYRGRTALMNAARRESVAQVSVLLDAGADPRVSESHGWSALHYAARDARIEVLREFHRRGIDLDLRSPISRHETPLMIAARFGEIATIDELIRLGADPRAKDSEGENVYGWAKYFNQPSAMEVLRQYR